MRHLLLVTCITLFVYSVDAQDPVKETPSRIDRAKEPGDAGYETFLLQGAVFDSDSGEPLPGVSVQIKGNSRYVSTDSNGNFAINARRPSEEIVFSFVGYRSFNIVANAGEVQTIYLFEDAYEEGYYERHHIRASVDAGYAGDARATSSGAMTHFALQSVGDRSFDMNGTAKFWHNESHSGFQISFGKTFPTEDKILPDHFFVSFLNQQLTVPNFHLRQTRGSFLWPLPADFAFDLGVGYVENSGAAESGATSEYYFSGIAGISKIFSYASFLRGLGLMANINYYPNRKMYEIGSFKSFRIGKLPNMTMTAKYYHNGTFDGLHVALRFNLFSTRYYCCYPASADYEMLDALR
jgi:hypothetical protein